MLTLLVCQVVTRRHLAPAARLLRRRRDAPPLVKKSVFRPSRDAEFSSGFSWLSGS